MSKVIVKITVQQGDEDHLDMIVELEGDGFNEINGEHLAGVIKTTLLEQFYVYLTSPGVTLTIEV